VTGGAFQPNEEVDELRWLKVPKARELLTYADDKSVLDEFAATPADTRTLLLVRHAKAGKREEWQGKDSDRPLSNAGIRQAEALRAELPLFGADRVHAAPLVRCVQTVRPLAEDLGRTIVPEPLLTEQAYARAPERGRARLKEILAGGGVPVVCSQGGVIPDLISALAKESGLELPQVPAKKGSFWVLSFIDEDLVDADYFATALPKP
jgi:8-oxo-dGTP diphosphatase